MNSISSILELPKIIVTYLKKEVGNGPPRQSNQNRMITSLFHQRLLESGYAAYCTTVSLHYRAHNLRTDSHRAPYPRTHSFLCASFLGPELSDAEYRRESRQALTGSSAEAQKVKITPNFSSAGWDDCRQCLCGCRETQRWRGRPLEGKKLGGRGGVL